MTADTPAAPRLTALHISLLVFAIAGIAPLAAISFLGSFHALEAEAVRRGFRPDDAWLVPIGADAGIVGFSILDLLLTGLRMPMPMLRHTVRLLTAATIWFNAAAGQDIIGRSMHAVLPLLFIVYIEAWRHLVRRRTGQSTGIIHEGIPFARWIAAPISTSMMKRRMILWGETNYQRALDTEQSIRHAYAQLRNLYGHDWKAETPNDVRWMLRTGVHIDTACARVAELAERRAESPVPGQLHQETDAAPAAAASATPLEPALEEPGDASGSERPRSDPAFGAASEGLEPQGPGNRAAEPAWPHPASPAEAAVPDQQPAGPEPLPEGMTFLDIARVHYKKCQRDGTDFDIKDLRTRYGGTPGHWRKIRNALRKELGPIQGGDSLTASGPPAESPESPDGRHQSAEEQRPALQNV